MNNDSLTTVCGFLAALAFGVEPMVTATYGPGAGQIVKLVGAGAIAGHGYFTNKSGAPSRWEK